MKEYDFQHFDILKIDVEGSEAKIFDDSSKYCIPKCHIITVEPHDYINNMASRNSFNSIMQFDSFFYRAQGELLVFNNTQ